MMKSTKRSEDCGVISNNHNNKININNDFNDDHHYHHHDQTEGRVEEYLSIWILNLVSFLPLIVIITHLLAILNLMHSSESAK